MYSFDIERQRKVRPSLLIRKPVKSLTEITKKACTTLPAFSMTSCGVFRHVISDHHHLGLRSLTLAYIELTKPRAFENK